MPSPTRLMLGVAAMLLLPLAACEITPPPEDPSSTELATAYERPRLVAPTHGAPASGRAIATRSSSDDRSVATMDDSSDDPFAGTRPSEARAFVAGGEGRVLCPARYRPQRVGESCACISSADGTTRYPMVAPCGASAARVEGNECIFTCSVPLSEADSP